MSINTNFLNFKRDDLDRPIYRIMSVHRLLEAFDTKTLALVKPEKWDDPFENLLLKSTAVTSDGERGTFRSLRDSVYGQCWTFHQETDAMWRIYSHDKQGVKVKTTIRKLLTALYSQSGESAMLYCFIGEVDYVTQKVLVSKLENIHLLDDRGAGIAESLLYKRNEFRHEKEVRLLYTQKSNKVHKFNIDPYDLFDEIVFDPRMEDLLFKSYADSLEKLEYKNSIRKSVLYRVPKALTIHI